MSEESTAETLQCAHEQCEKSLADVSAFVDVGSGEQFCSRNHLLAKANGDDLDG